MKEKKKVISFPLAIIPLLVMIGAMVVTIVKFEGSPHVPLILGTIVASFIAWRAGFVWKEIEDGIYEGIRMALPAIVIIIMVGLTIGAWIGGGIVATMIFYGLKLISPSLFLISMTIICSIVSIAIGSSWSTMGTIGVAGIGIGVSMGIPAPMVAGAIISGAYFGDKMSPLSDTTNLAAGIAGTDLFDHIKHMFYTTVPAFIIALIVYGVMGRKFADGAINNDKIAGVLGALEENFMISPWLLLVPVVVILLVVKKVPALPALTVGIILGWLCHILLQGGSVGEAVNTLQNGFVLSSGNELVDSLFNRGGIDAMMYTVSLTIVAMTFGGVMEQTGMLKVIVNEILKLAKTGRRLVVTTILSSFFTNVAAAEQYISIVLPGRMFKQAFADKSLHPKNLSRAVEDGGTVTSVFVPWNTCGVFIFATLGVHPFEYAPYAIFNFVGPLIAIIMALLGYKLTKLTSQETTKHEINLKNDRSQHIS
ncbi:Na+/H+ antiporter NhaC [Metabacillus herbersteinensis]|uniref:Na+/H+ antiporter NhaC n=1 Tax=Metabacillus herbersteinensis TaxID=283816 RepID=A0ABV6GF70_9BACI